MIKKMFFFLFLILTKSTAYSCDCDGKPSVEENWKLADQIFTAKIIKIDSSLYGAYGGKVYSFTIQIEKVYKDEVYSGRKFRNILAISAGSCDYFFNVGSEYLIYAKSNNYTLSCSFCSRTDLVKNVNSEEFELLDKLKKKSLESNSVTIRKFQNDTEYQIDLVKNSFKEKLKRKNSVIFILSSLSFILLIILVIVMMRKKF